MSVRYYVEVEGRPYRDGRKFKDACVAERLADRIKDRQARDATVRATECDCQAPDTGTGVDLISNYCPVHS